MAVTVLLRKHVFLSVDTHVSEGHTPFIFGVKHVALGHFNPKI
jgi:hypothetical protein